MDCLKALKHRGIIAAAAAVLVLAACSGSVKEQSYTVESGSEDTYAPRIYNAFYEQANTFNHDLLEGHFNSALKHYNPKEVEMYGGKDSVLKMMALLSNYIKDNPKSVKQYMPEKLFKIGNAIAGIAKAENTMTMDDGQILKSVEWLLGVSENGGNFWYFANADPAKIKLLLPGFNNEFVIPQHQEPYSLN